MSRFQALEAVMTLRDGKYLASCKERNALSAAMNGRSAVFPEVLGAK